MQCFLSLFVAMVFAQNPESPPAGFPSLRQSSPYYPNPYGPVIPILRQHSNAEPGQSYNWGFEAANGITAEESGNIIPLGPELADKQVTGSFSYISPEGIPVSVRYYADSNGFRPQVSIQQGGYRFPGQVQQP
ncbi:cuticle protein CP14.6-like isoform X2 [Photinus pyralis]|uniref:cuticle protein CP14.6-like isoform X2 n=1 Tax=Photinus pyralis TaxID=7054 RepID=UPI001267702A|nr:cuticle protein CP14.6-like isoform X2 [Photinus pyralis]